MPDNIQRNKTDDFRRVETHVAEVVNGTTTERVTTFKEEVVPMAVTKVVRETIVPVITNRQTDSYQDGKIVATDHEVVPGEALSLQQRQQQMTHDDVARIVNEVLTRRSNNTTEVSKSVQDLMNERNAGGFKLTSVVSWFDNPLVLYVALAAEAAAIAYFAVLKGWLLN